MTFNQWRWTLIQCRSNNRFNLRLPRNDQPEFCYNIIFSTHRKWDNLRPKDRLFSDRTDSTATAYIDKWFREIVKPTSFYEHFSDPPNPTHLGVKSKYPIRRYFYNIDLHGRLYLEETLPKNVTSCIKDERFLNFFFSRIRWSSENERNALKDEIDAVKLKEACVSENGFSEYPFVSPCGREMNYIRPACSPIVFHSLIDGKLIYGGSLSIPFDPGNLAISRTSGKLYHKLEENLVPRAPPVQSKGKVADGADSSVVAKNLKYGLIRSTNAISLAENIIPGDGGGEQHSEGDDDDHWSFVILDESALDGNRSKDGSNDAPGAANLVLPIEWLPEDCEPSIEWAMPNEEE